MNNPPRLAESINPQVKLSLQIMALAIVYFCAGKLSISSSVTHNIISTTVFTAEGFALAATILLGRNVWPGIFLGQLALALYNHLALEPALAISAINASEAVLGAWLFHRFKLRIELDRLKDIIGFIILISCVLQIYSATLSNIVLVFANVVETKDLSYTIFSWWFANCMGQLIITPLALSFTQQKNYSDVFIKQFLPVTIITTLAGWLLFRQWESTNQALVFALTTPFIIIISARLGLLSSSLATLIITTMSLHYTNYNLGAFVTDNTIHILDLNLYLLCTSLTSLFVSVIFIERHNNQLALLDIEKIRAQQKSLQILAETLPQLVWTCSVDGECDYLSPQWLAYTGIAEDKQLGYGWLNQIHSDDKDNAINNWKKSVETKTNLDVEFRIRRYDGEYRWFKTRATPNFDRDGNIIKWFGTNTDIHDAKQSQQALYEAQAELEKRVIARTKELQISEDNYRLVITGSSAGIWHWDIATNVVNHSSRFRELLGYSEAEFPNLYSSFDEKLHPDDRQHTFEAINNHLNLKTPYNVEYRLLCKSGDYRWFLAQGQAMWDGGKPYLMAGSLTNINDRKTAELQLKNTNKRMSLATKSAQLGIWDFECNGQKLTWDEQLYTIYGIDPSTEITEEFFYQSVHPDDLAIVKQQFKDVLENGEAKAIFRIKGKNNDWRWVECLSIVERNSDQLVERVIGVNRDITEILERENTAERYRIELQKSLNITTETNKRFILATQAIKFGIWDLDLTTFALDWDDRQFDLMWIDPSTPAELVYDKWRERTHPDDLIFVENLLQECIRDPNVKFEGKFRVLSPTGELRWIGLGGLIDYDDEGKPIRMIGMNWDITKSILAERAALDAKAHLQNVIDAARSFSIISVDKDGIIKSFSTGAEAMLGYSADEVIDKTSPAIIHIESEVIARGDELSKQYGRPIHSFDVFVELARRGLIETREWTYLRKDGTTLPVRLSVTAITDIDGIITGFLGIANDITDEKLTLKNLAAAKETAEQANMAKSQFLANMSHEIRTPMNAILGMVQLLQNTDLTTRQKDYASKTQIAAKSLLTILNDILDFSKVEAGRMDLEIRPFQLDHLLRDISVILSANIGDKNIELILAIDPKIPKSLLGDALRLQQILINLASNAVKFTDYGEIIIAIQSAGQNDQFAEISFSIRDTGIGIRLEHLEKIFEGFSQAEASTTRRFGGTGLGLAISKNLVEMMGGTLQVKSEIGIGTEFIFTLQLPIDKQYTAINPTNWLPNLPTGRALNVLIVDDNASARQVISSMSTSIGWSSDCAASGAEALKLITARNQAHGAYDIVFIDWKMPDMDGWQTTEKIRELSLDKPTPVIIMVTAHGRELMASRMAENIAALDGFLIKPITASMLFDAVADATSGKTSIPAINITKTKTLRLKDLRILVVEDNLMNQQVAEELLSTEGAIVDLANNGKFGIEKIIQASPQYDVVLMDLQMPDMDGFTATKKIRRLSIKETLPIIAMTANVMSSDKAACLDAGMNDHIGKPIDLDLLVNTILFYCGKTTTEEFQKAKLAEQSFQEGQRHSTSLGGNEDSVIDLDNALQRIGGNSALFIRLIQLFINDTQSMPETLQTHLSNNAASQAADLMHTLKSLSATVGATQLSELSSHTEKLLRKDTTAFASRSKQTILVDELKNSLSDSIKLLNQIGDKLQAQQPSAELLSKNQDNAAILQILSDLDSLLATGNMRATRIFNTLKQDYGLALGDKLNGLDEALNQLDFKRALEKSRLLSKELS